MVDAKLVKELRIKSGAAMMDCKKALDENNGDVEKAIEWLRKKGLSLAAKKSGRVAAEGLVAAKINNNAGIVIEVNSETDFVARNSQFQELVSKISDASFNVSNLDELLSFEIKPNTKTLEEISQNSAVIGEKITLRRMDKIEVSNGVVVSYIHNQEVPGMGKIAVIIGLESQADKSSLENIGKMLAMHIAACRPASIDIDSLDPSLIEKEKDILREQSRASGKPDAIIEKMLDGRIRKFYEESVLLEQTLVMDGKIKVKEFINNESKNLNSEIKIKEFTCYQLGEGIVQEEKNFKDEVENIK